MSQKPVREEFNEETIIEYVARRLGGSRLKVELAKEDYLLAIEEAFRTYSRSNPKYSRYTLPVSSSIQKYPLPVIGKGIVEVQPERMSSLFGPSAALSINLGDGVVSTVTPLLKQTYGIDAIYETLIYGEMYQRVLSGDFQWHEEDGYLYINKLPLDVANVSIIYTEDHDYDTLPKSARDWIERYSLALCSQILGAQRSKFATPGPGGQQFLQAAQSLEERGIADEDKLRLELRNRTAPLPPTWGA